MKDKSNNLGKLIQTFFIERLSAQLNSRQNTIKSYRDAVKLLLLFMSECTGKSPAYIELSDITANELLSFLDYLENERNCSIRTRNQRLAAIRAFFQHVAFCEPESLVEVKRILGIPNKRFSRKLFDSLTYEEIDAILATPDKSKAHGRRDYALLVFMYNTGARVSETTGLKVKQIRFEKTFHVKLIGKGDKQRILPIFEDTITELLSLVQERNIVNEPDEPVFVNKQGKEITRNGIAYIIKKYAKQASQNCPSILKKHITPHTIRHTTAMHMLQSGVDLDTIRKWLGHQGLKTTHQYAEANIEMKKKALEKGGIIITPAKKQKWIPNNETISFLESL